MSYDDDPRSPFGRRRRPKPRSDDERRQQGEEDARRRRDRDFEDQEGPGDNLVQMLLKLARRTIAHNVHFLHAARDYRDDLERKYLLRALNNDEERYRLIRDRTEEARAKAREHFHKAVAHKVDVLTSWMEVQRGYFDYQLERMKTRYEQEEKFSQLVERIVGLKEEDLHQSTVKSVVLYEMIRDLIRDNDTLFEKLGSEDRKKLLEFALGTRKEPPDILTPFFKDVDKRSRPTGSSPIPRREGLQLVPLDGPTIDPSSMASSDKEALNGLQCHDWLLEKKKLSKGQALSPKTEKEKNELMISFKTEKEKNKQVLSAQNKNKTEIENWPSWKWEFAFENDAFTDEEVTFYVGPCIALSTDDDGQLPVWSDARIDLGTIDGGSYLEFEIEPEQEVLSDQVQKEEEKKKNSLHGLNWDDEQPDRPPRLRSLGRIKGTVTIYWHEWFAEHHAKMCGLGEEWKKDTTILGTGHLCRYRIELTTPSLNKRLRLIFHVQWTPKKGTSP